MDPAELIAEVPARLGLENPRVLARGGQKIVLEGELAGAPGVAKIVLVPLGPAGEIIVERAHREVEVLAAPDKGVS